MANWGEIKCPRCAELEDKLAKAVLALQLIDEFTNTHDQRAVAIEIAELKGQDDE
jgi:phage FluMu protein Com